MGRNFLSAKVVRVVSAGGLLSRMGNTIDGMVGRGYFSLVVNCL